MQMDSQAITILQTRILTKAKWHGDCDREVVLGWHATAYLTLVFYAIVEVLIQGSDDGTT